MLRIEQNNMSQQRRSIKNVKMTSKYHLPYMGTPLIFSITLILCIWGLVLHRLFELASSGKDLPYQEIASLSTLVATVVSVFAIAAAVLAAHRIAGVHIKLGQTFQRVEDGDLSTRLKFRSTDKLEEVEDAFNSMMEAVEKDLASSE